MFVFVVNRLDAAMERERLLALQKEKAKEEAKKRYMYVCSKIQYHKIVILKIIVVENQVLKLSGTGK